MLDQRLKLLLETVRRLIRREAKVNLSNLLRKIHPADIAHLIRYLSSAEGKWMFNLIENPHLAATVLREVEQETRISLLEDLGLLVVTVDGAASRINSLQ